MAKSLSDGVTTVMLPDDLFWSDQHSWSPVAQVTERTLTGGLVVNAGAITSGRPITLQSPDDNSAWITGTVLAQLKAWAAVPLQELTLILPSGTYDVMYRHDENGTGAVEADLVVDYSDPTPDDFYTVTIRLMDATP